MAMERERGDVLTKEAAFNKEIVQIPPEHLVFIDEAGVNLGMTRTHARSPVGQRAKAKKPKRQSNISLIGAIRSTEMCSLYAYDGPMDGDRFLSFIDEHLAPKLNNGDVVVMDNVRFHHIKEVKERLEKVGARALYLPPYSPERNPIEETWSLIKRIFRNQEARTIHEFVNTIHMVIAAVTENKIRGFFTHAGYTLPT